MVLESNDEFQFRPITRGLGFHSGAANQGKSDQTSPPNPPASPTRKITGGGLSAQDRAEAEARGRVTADSVSRLISSLPTLDFNESDLRKPAAAPKMIHTPLARTAAPTATQNPASSGASGAAASAVVQSAGPFATPPKQAVIPGIPARDARRMAGGAARSAGPVPAAAAPAPVKVKWSLPNFKSFTSGISIPRPHLALPSLSRASTPQPGFLDLTQKVVVPRAANLPETVVYDETKFRETPVQLSASLFDLLVVAGTTCIFAVALLLVTNTDLSLVIHNARSDWATRAGILLLFFSVHALYMVGSRSVAGCTLGEWAFDIQLGLPPEQRTAWYPIAICARYVVIVLTGYIVLPLLSMIMGRDITANLCGLKLYQTVK